MTFSDDGGISGVMLFSVHMLILQINCETDFNSAHCGVSIGCFRFPPACAFRDCDNFLMWNDTGDDRVDFSLTAKIGSDIAGSNFWIAVGISNDTSMVKHQIQHSTTQRLSTFPRECLRM